MYELLQRAEQRGIGHTVLAAELIEAGLASMREQVMVPLADVRRVLAQLARNAPPAALIRLASAVEHRPAAFVAQSLIVQDQVADRRQQLVALPLALQSPSAFLTVVGCGSSCGLDRIGGRTEFVRSHMRDDRCLAGSVGGVPRCAVQVSGGAHGMAARRACLGHRHLAPRPVPGVRDGSARAVVVRSDRFEERQDVFGTCCRPERQQVVIRVGERAAAPDRDEPWVADLRQDHRSPPRLLAVRLTVRQVTPDGGR
jgi:hypothetical protein